MTLKLKLLFSTRSITIIICQYYHTLLTAFSSCTKSKNATNYYSCHEYNHQNSQQYSHNYDIYKESILAHIICIHVHHDYYYDIVHSPYLSFFEVIIEERITNLIAADTDSSY